MSEFLLFFHMSTSKSSFNVFRIHLKITYFSTLNIYYDKQQPMDASFLSIIQFTDAPPFIKIHDSNRENNRNSPFLHILPVLFAFHILSKRLKMQ